MADDHTRVVLDATRRLAQATEAPLLLAVSGGIDSMVLLHAVHAVAPDRIAAVATFDHATGTSAANAVHHVARAAHSCGLEHVSDRFDTSTRMPDGREAAWRRARYAFLRHTARSLCAEIVTAHTRDDHVETVLMRVMRGSGARGLAALKATCDVRRPLLGVGRAQVVAYARSAGVEWVEDPSNVSPAFTRNRIRGDLLPALRRADPAFDSALLALSERAYTWRRDVDAFVAECIDPELGTDGVLRVASAELAGYDRRSLAVLWSSLASRAGLALDHRGTRRIVEFTISRPRSGCIPLAGGWVLEATRESYLLRRDVPQGALGPAVLPVEIGGSIEWGGLRFRIAGPSAAEREMTSPWRATIAADRSAVVRPWSAGDRLEPAAGEPRRRVTRYLSDVSISGSDRAGWPVVVAGDDVVWIPGVRRSDAATDRSGRPVRHYVCERIDR